VDGAMLITARAVQGAFGAMLVSSTKSLLVNVYTDGQERARAMAIWSGLAGVGAALGVMLSGVLTDLASWRWIFFINLPIAAVVIAFILFTIVILIS